MQPNIHTLVKLTKRYKICLYVSMDLVSGCEIADESQDETESQDDL